MKSNNEIKIWYEDLRTIINNAYSVNKSFCKIGIIVDKNPKDSKMIVETSNIGIYRKDKTKIDTRNCRVNNTKMFTFFNVRPTKLAKSKDNLVSMEIYEKYILFKGENTSVAFEYEKEAL